MSTNTIETVETKKPDVQTPEKPPKMNRSCTECRKNRQKCCGGVPCHRCIESGAQCQKLPRKQRLYPKSSHQQSDSNSGSEENGHHSSVETPHPSPKKNKKGKPDGIAKQKKTLVPRVDQKITLPKDLSNVVLNEYIRHNEELEIIYKNMAENKLRQIKTYEDLMGRRDMTSPTGLVTNVENHIPLATETIRLSSIVEPTQENLIN